MIDSRFYLSPEPISLERIAKLSEAQLILPKKNNLKEDIIKLKQQPGKAISTGGIELPARLIEWGLVDEFHMVIHPVIVGEGRRLFTEMRLPENLGLKLTESRRFNSGCMALRYDKIKK